ncbi:hypothetical protein COU57_01075 [Candidatus Pacearchaeota archaeon CG10_big_fil_rev_8_21_14_0_10_32_14]|nr:MAG: hypothetical protein COU57_01075 [Candidatus Pacearchaeota archaeon CG10_big_fil_rev_8_21_14_0_10_32_14]
MIKIVNKNSNNTDWKTIAIVVMAIAIVVLFVIQFKGDRPSLSPGQTEVFKGVYVTSDNKGLLGLTSWDLGSNILSSDGSGKILKPLNLKASSVNTSKLGVSDYINLDNDIVIGRNYMDETQDSIRFKVDHGNGGVDSGLFYRDPADALDQLDLPAVYLEKWIDDDLTDANKLGNKLDANQIGPGSIFTQKYEFSTSGAVTKENSIFIEPPFIYFVKDGKWWKCGIDQTKTGNFGCIIDNSFKSRVDISNSKLKAIQ